VGPFSTPAQGSIEALCQAMPRSRQIVKVLLLLGRFAGCPSGAGVACAVINSSDEVKLRNALTSRWPGQASPELIYSP